MARLSDLYLPFVSGVAQTFTYFHVGLMILGVGYKFNNTPVFVVVASLSYAAFLIQLKLKDT